MKRTLSVVSSTSARPAAALPEHLSGVGLEWWRTITATYEFDDPAAPITPTMRRRWCSRRCRILATWPAIPVPPGYHPRHSLLDESSSLPVTVWPAPAESVPLEVVRRCIDCGTELPERNGPGRPRIRCEACGSGEPVPDWQRPAFVPEGPEAHDPWLRDVLRVPDMPWEEPEERW